MNETATEEALREIVKHLRRLGKRFALVGGLGVSVRAEVRFTRDVDVALAVRDDPEVEQLVVELRNVGYVPTALVEHEARGRLATVRLRSPSGLIVDLIAASCGVETEIVDRATPVSWEGIGEVPVARAEDLLAMKVLSMTDRRLQDRIDARSLLAANPDLDRADVLRMLKLVRERGFDREQDLEAKLASVLLDAGD